MLSMPPARITSACPSIMAWAAYMMAFEPEAHTLFTVVHSTVSGKPAFLGRLPGRGLAQVGRNHVAHNHLLHFRGRHAGLVQSAFQRNGAQLGSRQRRQGPAKRANRRANGGNDDNFFGLHIQEM